jgi:hypothetical protein
MQIVDWYDELVRLTDNPLARLNRAVAVGEAKAVLCQDVAVCPVLTSNPYPSPRPTGFQRASVDRRCTIPPYDITAGRGGGRPMTGPRRCKASVGSCQARIAPANAPKPRGGCERSDLRCGGSPGIQAHTTTDPGFPR